MKKCIDTDTPPKMLAMNQDDIKIMYPKLDEDFRIISGDELQVALHAIEQRKLALKEREVSVKEREVSVNEKNQIVNQFEAEIRAEVS